MAKNKNLKLDKRKILQFEKMQLYNERIEKNITEGRRNNEEG